MKTSSGPMLTVVSRSFPPQVSGSAILLANLLSAYPGKVTAVAGYNHESKSDPAFMSPCPTIHLTLPHFLPRVFDLLRKRIPTVMYRSLQGLIRRRLIELGTKVVFAAFPPEVYLVATFLAARELSLPFYAHVHDLWLENRPPGSEEARFAERWEPIVLKEATRVLCMTEAMQDHYRNKYGIEPELLSHTIPKEDYLRAPLTLRAPRMARSTILFVGAVQPGMNLDALKVLAFASELLPEEYQLVYCTDADLTNLRNQGICSSRLQAKYVSRAEVRLLQSEAHVLVAPLSHKNCIVDEVRTVFSTKLLEYLVSGRPIVVFGPKDSYHVESARKNGWGYVVTEDSPSALSAAIVKVARDENLAAHLVRAALKEARSRCATHHANRLWEWVCADALHSDGNREYVHAS